ncbi:dyslexia-associated protein KIAA0319-like protein isoform X3 [Strongylocentrotus purpuratus]|uniref:EGF-like domain-containing protein n=1 Tax=Strongylocentrotus purpuratus TaxID=7668 RepID=A0A7M7N391_STRPU|nr:dyslexia-associated protein KIAA0319-like protein isoform X3 [Strongylocentrotus purpuratus]
MKSLAVYEQCLCKSRTVATQKMEGIRRKCCGCSSRATGLTLDWRSYWGQKVTILVFMMVLSILPNSIDGSCIAGEKKEGYVPSDVNTLNTYNPHSEIYSLDECIDFCCRSDACDMAWMVEDSCYSVQCVSEETCQFRESTELQRDFVVVKITHQLDYVPTSSRECIPGYDDCQDNEMCRRDQTNGRNMCVCQVGYTQDVYGDCVYDDRGYDSRPQTSQPQHQPGKLDNLQLCSSDSDCKLDEFCFGLKLYDDGICASDTLRSVDSTQPPVPAQTTRPDLLLTSTTPPQTEVEEEVTDSLMTPSLVEVPVKKDGSDTTNGTEVSSGVAEGSMNTSDGNKQTSDSAPSLHDQNPATNPHASATLSSPAVPVTTATPTSTTLGSGGTRPFVQLIVSLGESKSLQLPDETSVSLHAFVLQDDPPDGQPYTYQYQVVTQPEDSSAEMTSNGQADPQVTISNLIAGFYQFKVAVSGSRSEGTGQVNVTVKPPPRINQPPVAIIQPAMQVVLLPNSATILDGSGSTDDDEDRIASYSWNQVQGPLNDHQISGEQDTLELTDLKPGVYLIRLTVTDFDGASNSTVANVTVKEEEDYKPHAQAGPDEEIKLPVDFTTLNGSKSSDDHGITSYEWTKMTDRVADMTGSSTKILHLTGLEEGTYVFKLTVTDVKGQKDSDSATVIVKPEHNTPPTADAGPNKELTLPSDATTLDGSGSTDDQGIEVYHWEQVSGPSDAILTNPDQATVDVSGLEEGGYVFRLTVQDGQGVSGTADVTVAVKRESNQKPIAKIGPDQEIILPSTSLEVDGSQSTDDKGIVSYLWTRSTQSPAAGVVVGNSNHEPILRVVDLVPGQYKFTLNVTDAKGAFGTDTTIITVVEDPHILSRVQIVFDEDIRLFTEQDKNDLIMPLAVMLGVNNGDVVIQRITLTDSNMLKAEFLAFNKTSHKPLPGPEVLQRLKSKYIMSQSALLKHSILEYDTVVCQKNCSNHGHCDPYTKRCVCETFWMENFIRVKFQDGESNCDWSILYVIIVCFLVLVALGVFIWFIACCCARRKKRGRRRHRYTLLEDEGNDMMEMHPKLGNGKQSSSIMISESGEESDDETTVFDIKRQDRNGSKPANGYVSGKHRSNRTPNRTDKL